MKRAKPTLVYWLEKSLYLNITNRCSNNCYFCLRNFVDGIANFKLKLDREPEPKDVIEQLVNYINVRHWKEVVFCGFGEPTANLNCLLKVAKWIRKHYFIPIRVDTNGHGYFLNPNRKIVEELHDAGVTHASISLNAPNREAYNEICRPSFQEAFNEALRFIEKAKKLLKVEITAVRVPELNVEEMKGFAESLGVPFRLRDYVQFSY